MLTKIVRQPVLHTDGSVFAYELLYEESLETQTSEDNDAANIINDLLEQIDTDKFMGKKPMLLSFTPNLLLKNIPKLFDESVLILQIDDSSIVHPLAHRVIYRYKKQGYKIAINNFEFAPRFFQLMDVVDVIKLNLSAYQPSFDNIVTVAKSLNKTVIAYNVNSKEIYDKAKSIGIQLMQGTVVADYSTVEVRHMDYMQSNFFMLVISINHEEPDMDEIAEIISRDVTLTYSLLKLVNSAYFALKNRATSVKQALTILGITQLKQWIYLLSFRNEAGEIPEELIRISFLRGTFCQELVSLVNNCPISKTEGYLLGMFSTLGKLLGTTLDDVLENLPISNDIKIALLTGEGIAGSLFSLVTCYENANWHDVDRIARELNLNVRLITQKYLDSVQTVNTIWESLMSAEDFPDDDYDRDIEM